MWASEVTRQLHPDTGAQENPTVPRGETQGTPGELESQGSGETVGQGGGCLAMVGLAAHLGMQGTRTGR